MKVLVATRDSVGLEAHDFATAIPGELVRVTFGPCDERECPCRWAFDGIASGEVTTVAKVVERPDLTRERYFELHFDAYRARMEDGPWIWSDGDFDEGGPVRAAIEEEIQWLLDVADDNEPGSLVRRDGDETRYFPPEMATVARVIQRLRAREAEGEASA